jgi:hypothetical protein
MTHSAAPPYRGALAVGLLVLAGYCLTLAPTVTFWDAGEFIAAAKVLGIPHPPGTPLFVLLAHVWGLVVPIGEFAVRTSLLSALCSAAGAAGFFLVVHASLAEAEPRLRAWIAGASAIAGAFTFTNWQNSNETEVYAVATFTIAAMAWTVVLWRRRRGAPGSGRLLLLLVYLAGLSIGNHLLALLAGPAMVGFLVVVLRSAPSADPAVRRREWAQTAVVAGVWALLIGTGLGSGTLAMIGAGCFLAAAAFAAGGGAGAFAAASLGLAVVGVTPYLFLFLRAAQHPAINEAAPSTVDALLAVIRRAQYPPRTPWDDPTVASGGANPGRSFRLLGVQLLDYSVWFDWQWARSLPGRIGPLPWRTLVTLAFASLGLRGMAAQRRQDRAVWTLLLLLFLVTGLGLVGYMNFKPGYARWYDVWASPSSHEVRERDYFFVVSFIVWGLWAGIGMGDLARRVAARGGAALRWAPATLALALVPLGLNWSSASRRGGADSRLAADFAYDLLNSAPPYAILFTYGDNDTFPLWWAQEVAGIRRDVTVVCLALANTDWYMRQLRDRPPGPLDSAALPSVWRSRIIPPPSGPSHAMTDEMIAMAMRGYLAADRQEVRLGPLTRTLTPGSFLYPNELLALALIQRNIGRRPIVWASTAGRSFAGLGEFVVQRGLGFELLPGRPGTTSPSHDLYRLTGPPLDVPTTERLVFETYRYAGLVDHGARGLEPTSASVAASLSLPPSLLVPAYLERRAVPLARRAADLAEQLSPNPAVGVELQTLVDSAADAATGPPSPAPPPALQ